MANNFYLFCMKFSLRNFPSTGFLSHTYNETESLLVDKYPLTSDVHKIQLSGDPPFFINFFTERNLFSSPHFSSETQCALRESWRMELL